MYSFSSLSWRCVAGRLDQHISADDVSSYYETVLAELVGEGRLSFQAAFFDNKRWYEIDTFQDLQAAERLFPAI